METKKVGKVRGAIREYRATKFIAELVAVREQRIQYVEDRDWISAEWAFENEERILESMRDFLGYPPREADE
jgi:hypothetical protein